MKELDNTFSEISCVIEESRANAYRKINEELILMYREIGRFLSEKSKDATYGDSYVDSLAEYIQSQFPGIKGFARRGPGDIPFSQASPPVTVTALMQPVDWGLKFPYRSVCRKTPKSKKPLAAPREVTLIPYGCAKLRMTEMPELYK